MSFSRVTPAEQTGADALSALEALDTAIPPPTTKPRAAKRTGVELHPVMEIPSAAVLAQAEVSFTPADYAWMNLTTAPGAVKLSASAVAPLVAAERGYFTITPDAVKAGTARLGVKSMNSAGGRQAKVGAETGDAMAMPWFAAASVAEAATSGRSVELTTYQLRP